MPRVVRDIHVRKDPKLFESFHEPPHPAALLRADNLHSAVRVAAAGVLSSGTDLTPAQAGVH